MAKAEVGGIRPRDRRFGSQGGVSRWWSGDNPHQTAIFNTLSVYLPAGENFFAEMVSRMRGAVDPLLAEQIRNFVTQETLHSREHEAFNRRAHQAGYDLLGLSRKADRRFAEAREWPYHEGLAMVAAIEHWTAVYAHALLTDPTQLNPIAGDEETADLWRWHCAEEIEHKALAFDLWLHETRDWSRFKRWRVRSAVMLRLFRTLILDQFEGSLRLLQQDGISGWKAWRGQLRALFVKPGLMRKMLPHLLAYFGPGFHPNELDDFHLVAAFDRAHSATGQGRSGRRSVRNAA